MIIFPFKKDWNFNDKSLKYVKGKKEKKKEHFWIILLIYIFSVFTNTTIIESLAIQIYLYLRNKHIKTIYQSTLYQMLFVKWIIFNKDKNEVLDRLENFCENVLTDISKIQYENDIRKVWSKKKRSLNCSRIMTRKRRIMIFLHCLTAMWNVYKEKIKRLYK